MKNRVKILGIAVIYAMGVLSFSSCGNAEESHEHTTDEAHEHSGEEMNSNNMDMSEAMEVADCPKWENGEHQHSAYVCPMWEEEGELEASGDCPKCGMTLVAYTDVKEQHDSQQSEGDGHDHDH